MLNITLGIIIGIATCVLYLVFKEDTKLLATTLGSSPVILILTGIGSTFISNLNELDGIKYALNNNKISYIEYSELLSQINTSKMESAIMMSISYIVVILVFIIGYFGIGFLIKKHKIKKDTISNSKPIITLEYSKETLLLDDDCLDSINEYIENCTKCCDDINQIKYSN